MSLGGHLLPLKPGVRRAEGLEGGSATGVEILLAQDFPPRTM